MEHYIGEKISKPIDTEEKLQQYAEMADFCNNNQETACYMKDNENDYEIAAFPTPTFDELKQHKRDEIAADRFNYETGGITVDGAQIKTDRESVALLKGAYDEACNNPNYTVNWKAANGFVTLNAEQICTIYNRVKAHVQSSFDAEMRIDAQINAATTEEQIEAIHWVDPN